METTAAQEIPHLYRAVLAGVAELEARGRWLEAGRVRRAAIRTYGAAWDDRAHRQLRRLRDRVTRLLASREPANRSRATFDRLRGIAQAAPAGPGPDATDPGRA